MVKCTQPEREGKKKLKTTETERDTQRAAAAKQSVLYSVVLNTDLYATNEGLITAVREKSQGSLDKLTEAYIEQIRFDGCLNGASSYMNEKLVIDVISLHGIDHDIKQVTHLMNDLGVYTPRPVIALYMYLQAEEFRKYCNPVLLPCSIEHSLMIGEDGRPIHVKVYLTEDRKLEVFECRHGACDWSQWFWNSYHFLYAYPRFR